MIMYKAISNVEKETKNVMNATVNAEKEIKIEGKEMKKKELVSIDEEKEVLWTLKVKENVNKWENESNWENQGVNENVEENVNANALLDDKVN